MSAPTRIPAAVTRAAAVFGVSEGAILSDSRDSQAVAARHAVAWVLRNESGLSLIAIGRILGRDHSTVMYAIRAAEQRAIASVYDALQLAALLRR